MTKRETAAAAVTVMIRSSGRRELREALASVAAQTYPAIDVVVVDVTGGAHPPLEERCGEFPARLVSDGVALPRSRAANVALGNASGEYLIFLDDDDTFEPDHIAGLMRALADNGSARAAYAGVTAIDAEGAVLRHFNEPFDRHKLMRSNFIPIHALLFHRSLVEEGCRFDEELIAFEDWDFWLQLAQRTPFIHVDRLSAVYRAALGSSGLGSQRDEELRHRTHVAIFEKWKAVWTAEDLAGMALFSENELFDVRRQLADAGRQIGHRDDRIMQLEAGLAERDRWVAERDRWVSERDRALQALMNSRSWRVTRPLRWLSGRARQLRNGLIQLLGALRVVNWPRVRRALPMLARGRFSAILAGIQRLTTPIPEENTRRHYALSAVLPYYDAGARAPAFSATIDIVIPVYNGMEFLPPLFASLARNTDLPHRLIIVDDASSDERVWPYLQQVKQKHAGAVLLRNASNLGFVRTVNRAWRETHGNFVLLNTDVEVPPAWLSRLVAPIIEDPRVASVTPFTNAATIFSFPVCCVDNPLPAGLHVDEIDECFRRVNPEAFVVEVPTGVGFCMAINGDVAKRIGFFDEASFGKGYGEENDWCMRAQVSGYHHRVASNLFVYHKHGGSFSGAEKKALLDRNLRILFDRHPRYPLQVDQFIRCDPLGDLRAFLTMIVFSRAASKKPLLIFDHNFGGGATQYRQRLIAACLESGQPVLLVQQNFYNALSTLEFHHDNGVVVFDIASLEDLIELAVHLPLTEILYNNAVSFIAPFALPELLIRLKAATGARLTLAFHDFFVICPSYTLLDNKGMFCDIPAADVCHRCLPHNPHALRNASGKRIEEWRWEWAGAIAAADELRFFSHNTVQIVGRVYTLLPEKITVRPHAVHYVPPRKPRLDREAPLHIGVVGTIAPQKGAAIVAEIAKLIAARDLPVRLTVIGTLDPSCSADNVDITGPYAQADLPDIIEKHGINMFLFPSVWPETFSYVTSELMALEVPLACFDLGAPAERVRDYAQGLVVSRIDAAAALEEIVAFHERLREQARQAE